MAERDWRVALRRHGPVLLFVLVMVAVMTVMVVLQAFGAA